MVKAVTSKTESLTIRVPIDLLAEWKAVAGLSEVSVAGLIIATMTSHRSQVDDLVAERNAAQVEAMTLRLTGDAAETVRKLRDLLAQASDERQELLDQLTAAYLERDERDAVIVTIREDLAQAQADIAGFRATKETYLDKINRADAEISGLKKALAVAQSRPRADPPASADPESEKAVAKALPVTGTQFDRQPTWWQKQQAKGKPKP